MSRTRTAGLPVRSGRLLDALFKTLIASAGDQAGIDGESWIEAVRVEFLEWKKQRKNSRAGSPLKEDAEQAVALIALQALAERLMLARGEDIRSQLSGERVRSILEQVDERDLDVYRRCEIELERPTSVAASSGAARDEILRRWSRARHHLTKRLGEKET